jgi:hypothetical protein
MAIIINHGQFWNEISAIKICAGMLNPDYALDYLLRGKTAANTGT